MASSEAADPSQGTLKVDDLSEIPNGPHIFHVCTLARLGETVTMGQIPESSARRQS
jgi:hypothetical protein